MTQVGSRRDVLAHMQRQVNRQIDRIRADLKDLSERLEIIGRQHSVNGDAMSTLHDVEHALRWGIANMPMGALIRAAEEVTEYQGIAREVSGLVGVTAAAEMLDLTRSRIQQLIDAGELPATKVGRQYLLHRDDVLKRAKS